MSRPLVHGMTCYRLFTRRHLDCLRLAWLVYGGPPPSLAIHLSKVRIIRAAVGGDLAGALELARSHLAFVQAERTQAEIAADLLERWAAGAVDEVAIQPLSIGQVARLPGVSIDMVRNWDRNGLIDVPRDPASGYRRYGAAEISRLRIIRMLSRSGYSIAAILRMLLQLDEGKKTDLRRALDIPRPDEDAYLASDRWLSTLAGQEQRAHTIIALLEEMMQKQVTENC